MRENVFFNKTENIKNIFNKISPSDFIIQDLKYQTIISTSDYFKFCLTELNKLITNPININISFNAHIEYDNFNRIDFESGIIDELKGLKLGYKLYIALCNHYNYTSTMNGVNPEAKNMWFALVHDNNVFVIVNKQRTLIINKNYNDIKTIVDIFLKQYPNSDLDDELKNFLI